MRKMSGWIRAERPNYTLSDFSVGLAAPPPTSRQGY